MSLWGEGYFSYSSVAVIEHANQKLFGGLFGLHFQLAIHHRGKWGKEFKKECQANLWKLPAGSSLAPHPQVYM